MSTRNHLRKSNAESIRRIKRYAYMDEHGADGPSLFEDGEALYWVATLVSSEDMDALGGKDLEHLFGESGMSELEPEVLGLAGFERIAAYAASVIERRKLRFIFVRINKRDHAATRLFDLLFEAALEEGILPAEGAHSSNVLPSHSMFLSLMGDREVASLWRAFQLHDAARLEVLLLELLPKVGRSPYSPQERQILIEILRHGAVNAARIVRLSGPSDTASFVSFVALITQLRREGLGSIASMDAIVHRPGIEFASTLAGSQRLLEEAAGEDEMMGLIQSWLGKTDIAGKLTPKPPPNSFGVQFLRICLWLMRQVNDHGLEPSIECGRFVETIRANSALVNIDATQLR